MATIDLCEGLDLDRVSPVLDKCWRQFMEDQPSNAENLTFAMDNIPAFKQIDAHIRELARTRQLLAPGPRPLLAE